MLRDLPAHPDAEDAADAAEQKAAEELPPEQHAEIPERIAEDRRPGEDVMQHVCACPWPFQKYAMEYRVFGTETPNLSKGVISGCLE